MYERMSRSFSLFSDLKAHNINMVKLPFKLTSGEPPAYHAECCIFKLKMKFVVFHWLLIVFCFEIEF